MTILIGVGLEVMATMAGTIGKQLLRYSKLIEDTKHAALSRNVFSVGLGLNVIGGPLLEIAAFGQAPQTLLAPLSGLDVLWNVLLVPHTLGESPSFTQFCGCLMIVTGTALSAYSGPHHERPYTIEVLQECLLTRSALTYIVAELGLLILGSLYMARRPRGDRRRGFVLGCVAGTIGGNLFCMKAASSLISTAWHGGLHYVLRVWTSNPLPILVTVSAILIGIVSAVLLAGAMREYEATMMVATYEGAFLISGCASGIAVLGELDGRPAGLCALYALGVLIVVVGVLAAQHHDGESEESGDSETSPVKGGAIVAPTNGASVPLLKAEP